MNGLVRGRPEITFRPFVISSSLNKEIEIPAIGTVFGVVIQISILEKLDRAKDGSLKLNLLRANADKEKGRAYLNAASFFSEIKLIDGSTNYKLASQCSA